jgi:hypothetical protein
VSPDVGETNSVEVRWLDVESLRTSLATLRSSAPPPPQAAPVLAEMPLRVRSRGRLQAPCALDDGGPSSGPRRRRAGLFRARAEAAASARQRAPTPHHGHVRGPRGRLHRLGGQPHREGGGAADRPSARLGLQAARPGATSGAIAPGPARPPTDWDFGRLRALRLAPWRAGGAQGGRTTRGPEHAGEPGPHLDLPLRNTERACRAARSSAPDRTSRPTSPRPRTSLRPTRRTSPPHHAGPARSGVVRDSNRGALPGRTPAHRGPARGRARSADPNRTSHRCPHRGGINRRHTGGRRR